jgi:regulator of sigma E protease
MSFWWAVGAFIVVLTPIILVHELGHFIAARLSGIRVEEFGLGFPPRATTLFKRGNTSYSLNWIPVGGFVRPAGEDDPSVADGLAAASKKARFFTLVAGAGANFVLAIVIFWFAFYPNAPGYEVGISAVVDETKIERPDGSDQEYEPSPAQKAGLQAGDIILAIDGRPLEASDMYGINEEVDFLIEDAKAKAGQEIVLKMRRDGSEITIPVTPRLPEDIPQDSGAIGIGLGRIPTSERISISAGRALVIGARTVGDVIWQTLNVPLMLIRNDIELEDARPLGPVGISQIAGITAERSANEEDGFPILWFAGVISVALGFTNLLPLPALDGGRILFVLIEAVRGRRIEPEREGLVHMVGMLVLLGLLVLITIQDLINPVQFP